MFSDLTLIHVICKYTFITKALSSIHILVYIQDPLFITTYKSYTVHLTCLNLSALAYTFAFKLLILVCNEIEII